MSTAAPHGEANQRLAANLARRSTLFKLTLGAGVSLFLFGLFSEVVAHLTNTLTIRLFGTRFDVYFSVVCWVAAVYPFVLAFRAIWLPDEKLRRAGRNLCILGIALGTVAVVWVMSGGIRSSA